MEVKRSLTLVIDIREFSLVQIATIDLSGTITHRECIKADGYEPEQHIRIIRSLTRLFCDQDELELSGIGICADPDRKDAASPLTLIRLIRRLTDIFDLTCTIIDRMHAMTIAEQQNGAGAGFRNFMMLGLNSSVSSSVVIDGEIVSGKPSPAHDLGQLLIREKGRMHLPSGKRGTVNAYCSGKGMVETAIMMRKRKVNVNSLLHRFKDHELHEDMICHCANAGDVLAGAVIEATARSLGFALIEYTKIYRPEVIVLTGTIAEAGDRLIGPAQEILDRWSRQQSGKRIKLSTTKINPLTAAVIGTAIYTKEGLSNMKGRPLVLEAGAVILPIYPVQKVAYVLDNGCV